MNHRTDVIAEQRHAALTERHSLDDDFKQSASLHICDRVIRMHEFMACNTIACYLPTSFEVDPTTIISRAWRIGKEVYSPVVADHGVMVFRRLMPDTTLKRNRYGIWEPQKGPQIAPREIDFVVTPVVAFDRFRHRIGMGSGYFDRCFSFLRHRRHWCRPKLTGLAFECQRVEKIIPNPWDIRLYKVVTETL